MEELNKYLCSCSKSKISDITFLSMYGVCCPRDMYVLGITKLTKKLLSFIFIFLAVELDDVVSSIQQSFVVSVNKKPKIEMDINQLATDNLDIDMPIEIIGSDSKDDDFSVETKPKPVILDDKCYFKLGVEGHFLSYENQYSTNTLAKSKAGQQAERDKRRYLGNKFCLIDFNWNGQCYQGLSVIKSTLRSSFLSFESTIPTAFLHPVWYKQLPCWIKAVRLCNDVEDFAALLLLLEEMIKPIVMVNIYKDACGALKLNRVHNDAKLKGKTLVKKVERDKDIDIPVEESGSDCEEIRVTREYSNKF